MRRRILDRIRGWFQHPAVPRPGSHAYVWNGTVVHRQANCLTCGLVIRRITAQSVEPAVWVHRSDVE